MPPTPSELDKAGLLSGYARVSEVLKEAGLTPDFSRIPPSVLERKRQIGTATHKALELLIAGRLDRATLDPAVQPFFAAGERWLLERKPFVVACEETVCDRTFRIKGTLDLRVRLEGEERIIDFKTSSTVAPSALVQVSAYGAILDVQKMYEDFDDVGDGKPRPFGIVVQLKKDGSFAESYAGVPHGAAWHDAARLYCFRRDNGLLKPKGEEAA